MIFKAKSNNGQFVKTKYQSKFSHNCTLLVFILFYILYQSVITDVLKFFRQITQQQQHKLRNLCKKVDGAKFKSCIYIFLNLQFTLFFIIYLHIICLIFNCNKCSKCCSLDARHCWSQHSQRVIFRTQVI